MNRLPSYLFLALATLFWGGTQVVAKFGLREVSPLTLATWRFLVAGAVLVLLVRLSGGSLRYRAADWRDFALLGLTGVFGFNLFLFSGLHFTSASESALMLAASPVVGGILGWQFRGERLGPVRVGGILLSVAGLAAVVLAGRPLPGTPPAQRLVGDLLALGATCCWAVYTLLGKEVMRRHSPLVATAMAAVTGLAGFLAVSLLPGVHVWRDGLGMSAAGWASVLYMAILGGAAGFWAWYRGLEGVEVTTASTFQNLIPVWTLILGSLILGERLTWLQLLGGLGVVIGCIVTARG